MADFTKMNLMELGKFWVADWNEPKLGEASPELENTGVMRRWGEAVKNTARKATDLERLDFLGFLKKNEIELYEEEDFIIGLIRRNICGEMEDKIKALETTIEVLLGEFGNELPSSITINKLIQMKGGYSGR